VRGASSLDSSPEGKKPPGTPLSYFEDTPQAKNGKYWAKSVKLSAGKAASFTSAAATGIATK